MIKLSKEQFLQENAEFLATAVGEYEAVECDGSCNYEECEGWLLLPKRHAARYQNNNDN